MLFNSLPFVFFFLPLVLTLTYVAGRWNQTAAKFVILIFSLGFYAWWRPEQTPLLVGSIVVNYFIAQAILRLRGSGRTGAAQGLLVAGILSNLALLGWFKYANFVVDNINWAAGSGITLARIALPLAISFFTFQKIAYLMDTSRGETTPVSLLDFSVFAAFFPQLIAGPIVHFNEVMPQLRTKVFGRLSARNLMIGLVMFAMGMAKKTLLADSLAAYVNPAFESVSHGHVLSIGEAWLAGIGFSLQVYFDFSGYSDMAIGLGRMLGVKLPLNFHSPLRAANIADYWRRWHMTLQRFVVTYIFQPMSLPLNRLAAQLGLSQWPSFILGSALPVFITFVALGVWHGAGWPFFVFGAMHGVYLSINEAWGVYQANRRRKARRAKKPWPEPKGWQVALAHAITLTAVLFANVMFRSGTVPEGVSIWSSLTGLAWSSTATGGFFDVGFMVVLIVSLLIVFSMPNTQQIMKRFDPALDWKTWSKEGLPPISWTWKPNTAGYIFAGSMLALGVLMIQRGRAVFIYFNF